MTMNNTRANAINGARRTPRRPTHQTVVRMRITPRMGIERTIERAVALQPGDDQATIGRLIMVREFGTPWLNFKTVICRWIERIDTPWACKETIE